MHIHTEMNTHPEGFSSHGIVLQVGGCQEEDFSCQTKCSLGEDDVQNMEGWLDKSPRSLGACLMSRGHLKLGRVRAK